MSIINTHEDFRDIAVRVVLPLEDLIPEREPEGHWRLPAQEELDESFQNLVNFYEDRYHPTIVNYYKQRGQRINRKRPPKWTFVSNHFQVDPNQVVAMIVLRNPQISQNHTPTETQEPSTEKAAELSSPREEPKRAHEPIKDIVTQTSTDAQLPAQVLLRKVREKSQIVILKSLRPPSIDPFKLAIGDLLLLDGKQGLLVRAGGVAGAFIPYEVEQDVEEAKNQADETSEAAFSV